MKLAAASAEGCKDHIRHHLGVHGVVAEQHVDQRRLVLGPGAHQDVRLRQKEHGCHAVGDIATLGTPDLGRAHGLSTGMHGCTNGLEVIEGTRAVECINQEVRDRCQLKLLQPER